MNAPDRHDSDLGERSELTQRIDGALRELRRLIRSSIFLRGVAVVAAVLALLVLVSLGLDRLFRLSTAARVVLTTLCVGGLAWAAWKVLLRPFFVRLGDPLLADRLERYFPELGDTLRSAIDFRRDPSLLDDARRATLTADERLSLDMKREVTRLAATRLETVEKDDVVDTPHLVETIVKSLVACAIVGSVFLVYPTSFGIWFERNILFGATEWPYATRLFVEGFEDGRAGVPRGDPLDVIIRAEGEDPMRVFIRLEYENESSRYNLPREGTALRYVYRHPSVTEAFSFTVEGGDYRSPPYRVEVLERPVVDELAVTVTPPAYTEREPTTSSGALGELAAPAGSTLRLEGRSNKDLRRAWIKTENQDIELAVNGAKFDGSYLPSEGGAVTVFLEDVEQVPPDQLLQFSVHLVPDRAPKVSARVGGLGSMITAHARMPIEIDARDDYRIDHFRLDWTVVDEANEETSGEVALEDPDVPGDRLEEERVFEVSTLGIEPERRLTVRVAAIDNDGLAGAKAGSSSLLSFLVVTPERLGEEFVRREEEQRRVLERLVEVEKSVRDSVYELVSAAWKEDGSLEESVIQRMLALARIERQHARQSAAVANAVRQILTEMENNRIGEADDLQRMADKIISPLRRLSEDSMPAASVEFSRIRDQSAGAQRVAQGLALAERVQDHVTTLEEVIQLMVRLESFTEIVKYLRSIIKVHDESTAAAKNRLEGEIQNIFETDEGFIDDGALDDGDGEDGDSSDGGEKSP